MKKYKQYIICAFPAMGKTTFMKKHKNKCADYDRCYFQYVRKDKNIFNPTADNVEYETEEREIDGEKQEVYKNEENYVQKFIDTINRTPQKIKYIFASSNEDILNGLEQNEMPYYLVLPEPLDGELPKEYINRYYKRFEEDEEYSGMRNNEAAKMKFIDEIKETYETLLNQINSGELENCIKIIYVKPHEFLNDVLSNLFHDNVSKSFLKRRRLYESIMILVAKQVKHALNEYLNMDEKIYDKNIVPYYDFHFDIIGEPYENMYLYIKKLQNLFIDEENISLDIKMDHGIIHRFSLNITKYSIQVFAEWFAVFYIGNANRETILDNLIEIENLPVLVLTELTKFYENCSNYELKNYQEKIDDFFKNQ